MPHIDLDAIVGNIDRCVLILGPDAAINQGGTALMPALYHHLAEEANLAITRSDDDLLHFADKSARLKVLSKSRDFFKARGVPHALHEQLAQMPFPVVISTTPDLLLRQAFSAQGIGCDFHYYNKVENPRPVTAPTPAMPLVFNLFGCVEVSDSLVFSQDDLFDYLFAILGERGLPRELKAFTEKAEGVVFIGFDFDKWYFKLLLKLLFPNREKYYSMMLKEAQERYGAPLKSFYSLIFDIEYVETSLPDFVSALHGECAKRGLLRETAAREELPVVKRVRNLIKAGELAEAIQELELHLDPLPDADEELQLLSVITGEYNRLRRRITSNSIPPDDATIQTNNIAERLLSFAQSLG